MDRFLTIMTKAGWLCIQLFIFSLILCGIVWLAYTNYAALKVSLEYSGFDMAPLGEDPLSGWVWQSLGFYNLSIADLVAAIVAFVVFLLCAVIAYQSYAAIRIFLGRKQYEREGLTAEQVNIALIRHGITLGLAFASLIPIMHWDIQEFRLRTIVPILGMENNAFAVKDWPIVLKEHGDKFVVRLLAYGGWAYVFLPIGLGLLFELWRDYVREAGIRLKAAFIAWFEYITGAETTETTQPQAAQTQQEAQTAAPHATQATQETWGMADNRVDQTENVDGQAAGNRQGTTAESSGQGAENVEWPDREEVKPNYMSTAGEEHESEDEVPVYGGKPGEKVKFSVAAADPENYYIDEMRRVWRRAFRFDANEGESASAVA